MAGAGVVRCTDGAGSSQLEWTCDRDDAGGCPASPRLQSTSSDEPRADSSPCVDVPVSVFVSAMLDRPEGSANQVLYALVGLSRSLHISLTPPCDSGRAIEYRTALSPPGFAYSQSVVMLI